jgi:hypothetical protein
MAGHLVGRLGQLVQATGVCVGTHPGCGSDGTGVPGGGERGTHLPDPCAHKVGAAPAAHCVGCAGHWLATRGPTVACGHGGHFVACFGQTVNCGRQAGHVVVTWGHCVFTRGQVVGFRCGQDGHCVFRPVQIVGPFTQAVGVAGQRVEMSGHWVDFGGQIVAFTPPLQTVGFLGQPVGLSGHHVGPKPPPHLVGSGGHQVARSGQTV